MVEYHGYTKVPAPYWDSANERLIFITDTSATTGSFKTQYFGDKYDPDKIERKLYYIIGIYTPAYVRKNPNYTLTLEIEKVSMVVSENSKDEMSVNWSPLETDQNNVVYNFTAPDNDITITLERDVNLKDVETNPYFIKKTRQESTLSSENLR